MIVLEKDLLNYEKTVYYILISLFLQIPRYLCLYHQHKNFTESKLFDFISSGFG